MSKTVILDEVHPMPVFLGTVMTLTTPLPVPVFSIPYRTDGTGLADLFMKGPDHEKDQAHSHVRAPAPVRREL